MYYIEYRYHSRVYDSKSTTLITYHCIVTCVNGNVLCMFAGVCTNGTAPSVSSINRILRNRAAERAAAEFARAAGYGLYQVSHPYASFPWPPHPHGMWPGVATDGPSAVAAAVSSSGGLPMHHGPSGASNKNTPLQQMINAHQPCGVMSSRDLMPRLLGEYASSLYIIILFHRPYTI